MFEVNDFGKKFAYQSFEEVIAALRQQEGRHVTVIYQKPNGFKKLVYVSIIGGRVMRTYDDNKELVLSDFE